MNGTAQKPPTASARWEHFPHQADVGVRGFGPTLAVAFEQAALALTAIVCEPVTVAMRERVALAAEGADDELLLAAWLNAVIYEMATRRMLFGRYQVAIDGRKLMADAWGEAVDVARHQPAVEPKGATFTALRVAQADDGGWLAQCVVDV
jgi:tRNA nucleotidyltransferase (CCA-adding enzyme)